MIAEGRHAQGRRIVLATHDAFTDQVRQFVESRAAVNLIMPGSSVKLQLAVGLAVRTTGAAQEVASPTASDSPPWHASRYSEMFSVSSTV